MHIMAMANIPHAPDFCGRCILSRSAKGPKSWRCRTLRPQRQEALVSTQFDAFLEGELALALLRLAARWRHVGSIWSWDPAGDFIRGIAPMHTCGQMTGNLGSAQAVSRRIILVSFTPDRQLEMDQVPTRRVQSQRVSAWPPCPTLC